MKHKTANADYFPYLSRDFFPQDKSAGMRDNSSMDEIDRFLARVEQARTQKNISERQLSILTTSKPDLIRDCRRNHHLPGTPTLAKLAQILEVSTDYLLGASDRPAPEAKAADVRVPFRNGGPFNDLPVVGTALGHTLHFGENEISVDQMTVDHQDIVMHIQRPPALAGVDKAYAVYIEGDSMYPRFKQGELAVVDPRRKAQIGDDVIVQLVDDPDDDGNCRVACVLVKELVRRSASWIELRQFNPDTVFRVAATRILSIHRIAPIGDLLGA